MQFHVSNTFGFSSLNAAKKAQNDIALIGKKIGYNQVPLFSYRAPDEERASLMGRMDGIIAPIQKGDIFFFQYNIGLNAPIYNDTLINKINAYGGHPVLFLHDVSEFLYGEDKLWPGTVAFYNKFSVVIAHTEQMKKLIEKSGVTSPIITLGIFDYLRETQFSSKPKFEKSVTVAGNIFKTPDVADWKYKTKLRVWSPREEATEYENIIHMGSSDPDTLPSLINSGFGLVWYSDSPDDEDAQNHFKSEYYSTLNSAHRLSLYLAAGIPLIVKRNLAQAKMVEDNKIGIVIDKIEEIDGIMSKMTEKKYNELVENVSKFQGLVTNGFFTQRAFQRSIEIIELKGKNI